MMQFTTDATSTFLVPALVFKPSELWLAKHDGMIDSFVFGSQHDALAFFDGECEYDAVEILDDYSDDKRIFCKLGNGFYGTIEKVGR